MARRDASAVTPPELREGLRVLRVLNVHRVVVIGGLHERILLLRDLLGDDAIEHFVCALHVQRRRSIKQPLQLVNPPASGIALNLETLNVPGRGLIEPQQPINLAFELPLAFALALLRLKFWPANRRQQGEE